jgi:hypothetical protein
MEIGPGRDYSDPTQKAQYNEQYLMAGIIGCILLIVNMSFHFVYTLGVIDEELYLVWSLSAGTLVGLLGYALISLGFLTLYQSHQHPILALTTIFFFAALALYVIRNVFLYAIFLNEISLYFWTGLYLVGGIAFFAIRFQIIAEETFTLTGIVYLVNAVVNVFTIPYTYNLIISLVVWIFTALSFYLIWSRYNR